MTSSKKQSTPTVYPYLTAHSSQPIKYPVKYEGKLLNYHAFKKIVKKKTPVVSIKKQTQNLLVLTRQYPELCIYVKPTYIL